MKRKIVVSLTVLVLSAAIFISCQAPKTVQVVINSEPQGATVYIDGDAIGQTPIKRDIKFKKKKERHNIMLKKAGYKTQQRYFHYTDNTSQLFQLDKD